MDLDIFLIPFIILFKRGLNVQYFFITLIFVYLIGNYSSNLTRWLFDFVPNINTIEIIDSNYIGLDGLDEIEYEDNQGIEYSETNKSKSFVYPLKDSEIEMELNKLIEEHVDGASKEKFIFWQTALAAGYNPINIPEYNSYDLTLERDKLKLYFSVGPLTILECLIESIKNALLVLTIFIVFRLKDKFLLFNDFKSLKLYFQHILLKK